MNYQQTDSDQSPAALEMDLMPYLWALIDSRILIIVASLVFAQVAYAYGHFMKPQYESSVRANIVDIEDPGGVSPDDRRAPEVLTLVEHGFIMGTTHDNYEQVVLARLRSRQFAQHFLDTYNIYRFIFPDQWDEQLGVWRKNSKPDRGLAFTIFRDAIRLIEQDEETGIITIKMRWHDANLAMEWANLYSQLFNTHMRQKTLTEADRRQQFLLLELERSDLAEMEKSIYRLIEAQTAIAMLAHAREEYALEIIDPGALPYASMSMSPRKIALLAAIAGGLFTSFLCLARVLLGRLYDQVISYRRTTEFSETA